MPMHFKARQDAGAEDYEALRAPLDTHHLAWMPDRDDLALRLVLLALAVFSGVLIGHVTLTFALRQWGP